MSDRFQSPFARRLVPACAALFVLGLAAQAAEKPSDKPPASLMGDPLPHDGWVRGAAFSSDSKRVVTCCSDGFARVWEVSSGKLLGKLKNKYPNWSVAFSPDDSSILVGTGDNAKGVDPVGEAVLFDADKFKPIGKPLPTKGPIFSVGFALDKKKLVLMTVCTDGTAQRWNALTSDPINEPQSYKKSIWCAALSPNGETAVIAPLGPVAHMWVPSGDKPDGTQLKHNYEVQGVAFSADGKRVATAAGHDNPKNGKVGGEVKVWDAATGDQISKGIELGKEMQQVALSPLGDKVLAGGDNKQVVMWDVGTGQRVGGPMKHSGEVLALALSPDGRYLIVGGNGDNNAQLWEFTRPLK